MTRTGEIWMTLDSVSPVFETVHDRFGFSRVIKEQSEGHRHGGEERRASRRAV
jgi:hypothetical protein